jgi:O-antigen/teichoic acid export membrane protein
MAAIIGLLMALFLLGVPTLIIKFIADREE